MIVLGLDGALGGFSAAIARDGQVVASRALDGNVALEGGLVAVTESLRSAGVSPRDLDRIAVGVGPGGFTGLRITIAYAKSLAQAWERPLVPISSFDALEYGLNLSTVLSVVVGRTGVISARLRLPDGIARASGWTREVIDQLLGSRIPGVLEVIGAPEDVLAMLAEAGWTVRPLAPILTPPAASIALAGTTARPAASAHEVRADYGELPAAKVPDFRSPRIT